MFTPMVMPLVKGKKESAHVLVRFAMYSLLISTKYPTEI